MFLDIAFFFKDENKDIVTRILDAFGFHATSGVEILEDKALISISNSNRILMHSLIQKMAFDIVRQEHNKEPGKRSRLRDAKDISDVLGNNKGSDAIEGIIFDLSQKLDIHVQADTFNLMTKLRFLKFHIPSGKKKLGTVHLAENIMPFFDKLTYLEWNGYPLKSLPQPFRAEKLIQICLPNSNIEHLWYGKQEPVNLEVIDLSGCKQLIELPDLSGAIKLKELRLSGCSKLCEIQASAFSKDTLDTLLLDGCTQLPSLMGEKHLRSLANFSVRGCSSLKEFSLSSDSIKRLDLSNTGIEILHSSIGCMDKLSWLNLEGLNLTNLPNELSRLRSLTELRVSKCSVITKSKLEALFDGLDSLTLLHLKDCCNLLELPANISSLSSLHELRLDGSSVEELPDSIKSLSKLEVLSLHKCSKLRCLPELPSSIKEFHADNCTSLMKVSTLKTFSIIMIGKKKCISFKNSIKLELDEPSLDCSESQRVLGAGNLDKNLELELYEQIQFESRSVEGYDEQEGPGIQNQQSDLNENLHSSYECLIVSKDTQVHDNPQEKENLDDDDNSEEIMKCKILHESSTKSEEETETSYHKQEQFKKVDSTGRSSDVKSSFNRATKLKSKENEETQKESDAGLHLLPVVSAVVEVNASDNKSCENNYDWQDKDETKISEEKPNIEGGKIIVPDTNDLISEQEQEKENAQIMNLCKPERDHENGSDEDPFAELERILLGSPETSPKETCCSTRNVAISEALHILECLLENSLESIICDDELQQILHTSLECIKQATDEKVCPNVVRLVQKMTSSIENLFKDFVMTRSVVEDHINALQQKEKLIQRVRNAKTQKESKQKEKSQFENEGKRLEEEGEKVDEQIRILVERKKNIELEKTKLKESMERCEGEKKKVEDEAKNMITESKELMSSIKNSKSSYAAALSKQQKLKDKWEGFRIDFADNNGSSSSSC